MIGAISENGLGETRRPVRADDYVDNVSQLVYNFKQFKAAAGSTWCTN